MVTKEKMKQKIIYGSIFAAFLMVSIAFIQPVTARGREPVDLIQTPNYDMQEVEQLVEMISSDKQFLSYIEPLLQDQQINQLLEQMQVTTGPDEMYALLTELETLLMEMDLDPELGDLLMERYGAEIAVIIETFFTINDLGYKVLPVPPGPGWIIVILLWLLGMLKILFNNLFPNI